MTYISDVVVLSHEHVQRCAGVGSNLYEGRAAVTQQPQTEISALLRVLLKQQLRKLNNKQHMSHVPSY